MLESLHVHVEPAAIALRRQATIRIVPDDGGAALRPGECQVTVHPRRSAAPKMTLTAAAGPTGEIAFGYEPADWGECAVFVRYPGSPQLAAGSFYVVQDDLSALVPLRGDLHTHTWYSDGHSSPLALLRRAVDLGLDFIAVTDHNNYAGSLEALAVAPSLGGALTVLAGEEVTFAHGHVVAVGTRASVASELAAASDDLAAVAAEIAERGIDVPVDDYARCLWAARRVRALGGLAFIAHPFWVAANEYDVDWRVAAQLLRDSEVDGVELLGDVDFEDNLLSIAGYMGLLSEGVQTTVVGNSDTHGVEHTFGRYWTTVFARDESPSGVMEALGRRLSVACVELPGEQLRIYGPLHLVQYAYFLHRLYFPRISAGTATLAGDYPGIAAAKAGLRRRLLPS